MNWTAKWIAPRESMGDVAPEFVRCFCLAGSVEKAVLTVTAMGSYEALLNGCRISDYVLAPGWTVYEKRHQYQQYDVTAMLAQENELDILVGKCWYRGPWRGIPQGQPAGLIAQLEIFNQGNTNYHLYEYGLLWDYSQPEDMDAACIITVKNGYLSVAVTLCYREMVMMGYNRYFRTETATWDLIEGRRLTPEELFCEGVDIDDVLNDLIQVKSQQRETDFVDLPELLKDFVQLSPTGWHLTHDAIYFDTGGPVFAQGFKFDLDDLPDGTLVTEQLRDFAHCIDSENVQVFRTFRISDRDLYYAYNSDELVSCGFLKEDTHPNAAKINSEVMAYLNEYYTEDAIRGYYEDMGYVTDGLLSLYMMDWNVYNLGRKYLLFNGYAPEMYLYDTKTYHQYPAPAFLLYDIHTGSPMELDDLLLDGWEEAAVCTQDVPFLISEADCINIFFDNIY